MSAPVDTATRPVAEDGALQQRVWLIQSLLTRPLGVLVLLAGLATLSYSNTFSASFHYDDLPNIVENSHIRDWSIVRDVSGSRYIGFVTFAVNYRVGGLQVAGYHLVNLLIHMTNGWLVYTLVGLLFRTPGLGAEPISPSARHAQGVALLTALVFVVHPIQTQAVTYIVQRFTSLATLFYLLAVVCYLRWRLADAGPRYGWYAGALGATILAMKTKEISFTLPVLLVLVEGVGFTRPSWKRWLPLVPFALTLLIIPLSLPGGLGETEAGFARETAAISRLSYLFTQSRVLVTYLRLLICPIQQNLDYDYPVYDSLLAPPVLLSSIGLLCLLGLAVYLLVGSPRWKLVGFGLGWFFLTLAVESSFIPIRDVLVEHRLYLPSVGFLLAGSALVVPLLARWRALALTLGVGVVLLCAVATYQRNRVWHDEASLWTDVIARSPAKARGHSNLGLAYAGLGRWDEAIPHYFLALQREPDFPEAHSNLGLAYAEQGRWDEAIPEFLTALRLKPDFPQAHNNLGWAYARQGRLEEAVAEFATAIQLKPDAPEAHNNLGNAYSAQGRWDAAILEYRKTIQLQSDFPKAHNNLGTAYSAQGRFDEAIEEYLAEIQFEPDSPSPHLNLANAYLALGQLQKAIQEYQTVLRLQPDLPEAHYGLGNVYASQKRWEAAIQEYVTAIRLRPDFPEAFYNLGNVYRLQGLQDRAREQYERALRLRPDFRAAQQALRSLDGPVIGAP